MRYYIEDNYTNLFEADIISSDAFINCDNERRIELSREYRDIELEEMYQLINEADYWNDYDQAFYDNFFDGIGKPELSTEDIDIAWEQAELWWKEQQDD